MSKERPQNPYSQATPTQQARMAQMLSVARAAAETLAVCVKESSHENRQLLW